MYLEVLQLLWTDGRKAILQGGSMGYEDAEKQTACEGSNFVDTDLLGETIIQRIIHENWYVSTVHRCYKCRN